MRTGNWIENTIEVPLIPATNRGLKYHAAAEELRIISDEFFAIEKSQSTI